MNILILNWRDLKNPRSGGAEVITDKYAQYWVSKGHRVYWISNRASKLLKSEKYKGIEVLRVGPGLSSTSILNLIIYPIYLINSILNTKKYIKQKEIDIVIDEIHGLPFFSPLYSKKRNILLVCEVAGVIWDKMYPFPINILGKFLEKLVYKIYEGNEVWAISKNTRDDITRLNRKIRPIVLPLGIEVISPVVKKLRIDKKNIFPSAIFIARLVKMKGIEFALEATALIVKHLPGFKLFIIGRGSLEYEIKLKNSIRSMRLEQNVEFLGYVDESRKYDQLSKAHFLFHPSSKEGFGLTVLEAGLVGTPSIVRQGSSLDELVNHGEDGFIIKTPQEMAVAFLKNLDNKRYKDLCNQSHIKALRYAWDKRLREADTVTNI